MINIYQPSLGKEELNAIEQVFKSNWLGKGKLVEKFTRNIADKLNVERDHVETISSCTAGLFQSMKILGIGPGDEVIIPSIHFIGAINAIKACGAKPVFCDVEKRTLNTASAYIFEKITHKTKAVIILHYGGVPCDLDGIMRLCKQRDIKLIEDNANSPLSTYQGQNTGTFGDVGVWSFDSMKQIVMGEGGLIYCKDKKHIKDSQQESYYGLLSKSGFSNTIDNKWWEFDVDRPGTKTIITDVQAAMGIEQLKKIDKFIRRRRYIHDTYSSEFKNIEWLKTPPTMSKDKTSSYYMYHIQTKYRDELAKYLRENEIYTTFRYYPLHWVDFHKSKENLENTEYIANNTLCIPIHQSLTDRDINYIIKKVKDFK
jgi:dTDP-4-amino-4,6-dideoxygalactose transaminase